MFRSRSGGLLLALLTPMGLAGCAGGSAGPEATATATVTVTTPAPEPPPDAAAPRGGRAALRDVLATSGRWVRNGEGARVYRVDFTVRNSTAATADYVVAFELRDAHGDRVADVYGDVESLAPGQTARATAEHHPEHSADGASQRAVTVRAVRVDRY